MPFGDAPLPLIPYPAAVMDAPRTPLSEATRILATEATGTEARLLAEAIAARTGFGINVQLAGSPAPGDIVLTLGADTDAEGYRLRTAETVTISASDAAGVHWGAQTLRQLLAQDETGWFVRGADIVDAPRFAYRGAMLDVARHFFSVADVCTYIDALTAFKINVLHLHLTDDQGWRLEIQGYPALTERASVGGVGGTGGYYTQDDFRTIVGYAERRHMTIVPEIDTPGHTHAVSVAYPEFAAPTVPHDVLREQARELNQELPVFGKPYSGWGVGFSSVKIGDAATDAFVGEVFRQVAALTPGPWVHLGGDECLGTAPEDFSAFVGTAANSIAALGKTPMAWHEAGKADDLPDGMIGQYWGYRTPQPGYADEARRFVAAGGALVFSPADAAYLDMKYDEDTRLGLTWANGPTSIERANSWDPADIVEGVAEGDILGVEAPMWTETIASAADLQEMAFPRVSVIAEIGWTSADSAERAWPSVRARLAAQVPAWKAEGINVHLSEEIA